MENPDSRFTYEKVYSSSSFLADWFYNPQTRPEDAEIALSILAARRYPDEFDCCAGCLERAARERFGWDETDLSLVLLALYLNGELLDAEEDDGVDDEPAPEKGDDDEDEYSPFEL